MCSLPAGAGEKKKSFAMKLRSSCIFPIVGAVSLVQCNRLGDRFKGVGYGMGVERIGRRNLGVFEEDRGRGFLELIAAVEARDLEDEQVSNDLALQLLDEVGSRLGRATCKVFRLSNSEIDLNTEM